MALEGLISANGLARLNLPSNYLCGCPAAFAGPGCANFFLMACCYPKEWSTARARRCSFRCAGMALAIALTTVWGLSGCSGYAQEPHKSKVPGLDKITSGSSRLAFSGHVQSLDREREILNVGTVQGGNTEVFSVKKGIRVSAADGSKLKLDALKPGTNVIVYYEQKGEKRTVKEIVILSSGVGQEKKPPHPS